MTMQIKYFSGYQRDGSQVLVQRSSHGQHNLFEEHAHDFIELVYVVHGKGRHRINRDEYEVRPGDVFAIMPGESHAFPDVKEYSLELVNCLFQRETIAPYLPAEPGALLELSYIQPFYRAAARMPRRLSLTSGESTEVLTQLEDMICEGKEGGAGAQLIVRHLLINMLIRLSRIYRMQQAPARPKKPLSVGHDILVRNICKYLEHNFHQKMTTAAASAPRLPAGDRQEHHGGIAAHPHRTGQAYAHRHEPQRGRDRNGRRLCRYVVFQPAVHASGGLLPERLPQAGEAKKHIVNQYRIESSRLIPFRRNGI